MVVTVFTVSSDDPWIDTGIDVLTSQTLHISAAGFWSPVHNPPSADSGFTDPDGFPNNYVPVDGHNGPGAFSGDNFFNLSGSIASLTNHWGALCAYIGTPGTDEPPVTGSYNLPDPAGAAARTKGAGIFLLGNQYDAHPPANGRLYIRSSDDAYTNTLSDNAGSITVWFTTDTIPDNHRPQPDPQCGDIYLAFPFNQDSGGALYIQAWRDVSGTYQLVRSVRSPTFTGEGFTLGESLAFDNSSQRCVYFAVSTGLTVSVVKLATDSTDDTMSTIWSTTVADGRVDAVLDIDQDDHIWVIAQHEDASHVMTAKLYELATDGTVLVGPVSIGPGSPASANDPGGVFDSDGVEIDRPSLTGCAVAADGSVIAYADNYNPDFFTDESRIRRWNIGAGSQMADLGSGTVTEVHGLVYDADGNLWAGSNESYKRYDHATDAETDHPAALTGGHRFDIANTMDTDVLLGFENGHIVKSLNRVTDAYTTLVTWGTGSNGNPRWDNTRQRCGIAVRCAYPGGSPPPTVRVQHRFTAVIG